MAEDPLAGVPAGHGLISTLTADGDFRLTWDPADEGQVENARQAFADLRARGFAVHRIQGEGTGKPRRRDIVTAFDPAAGAMHLVAHRPPVGG